MDYKYNCGNEIIRVLVWNDDFHTEVSVTDNKTKKTYERTIREDEGGKFFTWNKNKIYLDNWIRITMKELKDKIDSKEYTVRRVEFYTGDMLGLIKSGHIKIVV